MRGLPFIVRNVNVSDSRNLLSWRNDPAVLRYQHTQQVITPVDHAKWLSVRLLEPKNLPFLAYEEDNHVIGYVRLDEAESDETIISILISPEFRGRGYGAAILKHFLNYVRGKGIAEPIIAYVHNGNIPSQKLFRSLSFNELRFETDKMIKFVYK